MNNAMEIAIDDEVRTALDAKRAVVALESTIFSHLGLPSPANREALDRCLTAVIDGVARVGIGAHEHELILGPAKKVGERELALAIAQRWLFGATTVSASLLLAARAGIGVFATGGIGGVHRGVQLHGDISADLGAVTREPHADARCELAAESPIDTQADAVGGEIELAAFAGGDAFAEIRHTGDPEAERAKAGGGRARSAVGRAAA